MFIKSYCFNFFSSEDHVHVFSGFFSGCFFWLRNFLILLCFALPFLALVPFLFPHLAYNETALIYYTFA